MQTLASTITEDIYVLHNTKDTASVIPALNTHKVSCPKCRFIMEDTQWPQHSPIDKADLIEKICEHCRKKEQSRIRCYECEKIVKKFLMGVEKLNDYEKTKIQYKNVRHILEDILADEKENKPRSWSLEQIFQREARRPNVGKGKLFSDIKYASTENLVSGDLKKKKIHELSRKRSHSMQEIFRPSLIRSDHSPKAYHGIHIQADPKEMLSRDGAKSIFQKDSDYYFPGEVKELNTHVSYISSTQLIKDTQDRLRDEARKRKREESLIATGKIDEKEQPRKNIHDENKKKVTEKSKLDARELKQKQKDSIDSSIASDIFLEKRKVKEAKKGSDENQKDRKGKEIIGIKGQLMSEKEKNQIGKEEKSITDTKGRQRKEIDKKKQKELLALFRSSDENQSVKEGRLSKRKFSKRNVKDGRLPKLEEEYRKDEKLTKVKKSDKDDKLPRVGEDKQKDGKLAKGKMLKRNETDEKLPRVKDENQIDRGKVPKESMKGIKMTKEKDKSMLEVQLTKTQGNSQSKKAGKIPDEDFHKQRMQDVMLFRENKEAEKARADIGEHDKKKKEKSEFFQVPLPKQEETEDSIPELTKELDIKQIKILRPSCDDFTLALVKIREESSKKGRVLRRPLSAIDILAMKQHKNHTIKEPNCLICAHSALELDIGSFLRERSNHDSNEIIIGHKIMKQNRVLDEKKKVEVPEPMLYKTSFDADDMMAKTSVAMESLMTVSKPSPYDGILRYALSDRKYIEKGWTLLPTEKIVRKLNVYRMRPAHPEFDWFEHNKNKRFISYDSGEKFAEFDDNGRGRWYYRNGNLSLDYYDAEEINAQQRFVIYSSGEADERGRSCPITVLASFDYSGNGIVFDNYGKIRIKYNQTEGIVQDRALGPVSHWKWHSLNDPPVLMQVMMDTKMSFKDPDIYNLVDTEEKMERPENEEMIAIEFDNFIKEKSKKMSLKFKPFQIKMKALKINEYFSLRILDQATIYLIYRDGTTNLKLNLGMILDNQEIVDTDTAEMGIVSSNIERFPARTESIEEIQRAVGYAQHVERLRKERERRLRLQADPNASVDRLTAGLSRPLRIPLVPLSFNTKIAAGDNFCRCKMPPGNVSNLTNYLGNN